MSLNYYRTICNREELNRLTNNIETPPTTPDSYKINITNSNPHSMSTKSQNISSNVKHNNYTDNKNQSHIKYIDAHVSFIKIIGNKKKLLRNFIL